MIIIVGIIVILLCLCLVVVVLTYMTSTTVIRHYCDDFLPVGGRVLHGPHQRRLALLAEAVEVLPITL